MAAGLLEGKVALITGAASGIGKQTAVRFAHDGAAVCVADRNEDEGRAVVEEITRDGGRAIFASMEVSNPDDVRTAVESTVTAFGRLDCVFANAGINGMWAPIEEIQPDEWDRTFDINLKGTYLTLHFSIPALRASGGGSIVITSSVNGTRTFSNAGASAYSASKAGQIALMKTAALELGRDNIRVNAICPGYTRTNIGQSTQQRDTDKVRINIHIPNHQQFLNGGVGQADDIAGVMLFLASDLSRHVSGTEIYVDGGVSLVR